jgi:hypothetical protein
MKNETTAWLFTGVLLSIFNSMLWGILGIADSFFDICVIYLLTLIIFMIIPILDRD